MTALPAPARPSMRAVVARRYGGPDVLEVADVPRPSPADDEVLVRVRAAGIYPADAEIRAGAAAGWFDDGPWIWGWDLCGTVAATGASVRDLAVGGAVFGMPRFPGQARAYAEYVTAPIAELAELAVKPPRLRHVEAAALPLCGLTAEQVLDLAGCRSGMRVLVNGAAGGVGHLAVQLAAARGSHVIGMARTANHPFIRELGAAEVHDYTERPVPEAVAGVDLVVDCVGDDTLIATVRAGGTIAPMPGAAGGPGALEDAAARRGDGVKVLRHVVRPDGVGLRRLVALVELGQLRVDVARTFPLADAARAHELLGASGTLGSAAADALAGRHEVLRASRRGPLLVDLTDPWSIDRLLDAHAGFDAVVCAAASAQPIALDALTAEQLAHCLDGKLAGQVLLAARALRHLAPGGSVTLTAGLIPRDLADSSIGALVNAGIETFVRAAAPALPGGRRLNAVSPGWVRETLEAMGRPAATGVPVAYGVWGLLHLALGATMAAGAVSGGLPDAEKDAESLMFFVCAAVLGALCIAIAATLNRRNEQVGYWLNLLLVVPVDIALIVVLIEPGHIDLAGGLSGPLVMLVAITLTTLARRGSERCVR